jgi:hypothetical protein
MEIPVLVEPVNGNGYRASTGAPLGLSAEAPTRDEALGKLRSLVEERLSSGVVVPFKVEMPIDHPWAKFAGMFKDDPRFDEWQEAIAEYRRKVDEDPDSP